MITPPYPLIEENEKRGTGVLGGMLGQTRCPSEFERDKKFMHIYGKRGTKKKKKKNYSKTKEYKITSDMYKLHPLIHPDLGTRASPFQTTCAEKLPVPESFIGIAFPLFHQKNYVYNFVSV